MREAVGTGRLLGQWLRRLLPRDTVSLDAAARAESLRLLGHLDEAEALCARVLEAYPQYASAHVVMGDIQQDKGAPEAAEAAWEQACRLHPQHPRGNLRLSQLYLARGELPRALAMLERALLGNPSSPEATRLYEHLQGGAPTAAPRPWLPPERVGELLAAVRACAGIGETRLVGPDGVLLPQAASDEAANAAARLAATLMLESRPLLERIGAGPLRAAFLCAERAKVELFEVSGYCLLSKLAPDAQPEPVRGEIQGLIAALRRSCEDGERAHVRPLQA